MNDFAGSLGALPLNSGSSTPHRRNQWACASAPAWRTGVPHLACSL